MSFKENFVHEYNQQQTYTDKIATSLAFGLAAPLIFVYDAVCLIAAAPFDLLYKGALCLENKITKQKEQQKHEENMEKLHLA